MNGSPSRHKLSGQRMMGTKTRQASGRASALRANRTARSTIIFKKRLKPFQIAVRADHEKCGPLTENRRRFCGINTSSDDQPSRIPSRDGVPLLSKR